jgi:hypothetical protein
MWRFMVALFAADCFRAMELIAILTAATTFHRGMNSKRRSTSWSQPGAV